MGRKKSKKKQQKRTSGAMVHTYRETTHTHKHPNQQIMQAWVVTTFCLNKATLSGIPGEMHISMLLLSKGQILDTLVLLKGRWLIIQYSLFSGGSTIILYMRTVQSLTIKGRRYLCWRLTHQQRVVVWFNTSLWGLWRWQWWSPELYFL